MRHLPIIAALCLSASATFAEEPVIYETDQSFDDVTFGLESAIIDAGLVIDHISHTGEMLERTRADIGSDKVLFQAADVYSFCSASVSRSVMEADLKNVMYCPYDIFVMVAADKPDTTVIGYRPFPEGPMQEVQQMLDGIVRNAIGIE
ncbi:DUF302 domain-containing protein [Donghicola tyrosinivorans]|uniref:DUF302 domain-containing protein n=1 Tax=Donghicola tyrosinivorans TaxID=1652492 RepID=A0A2T0WYS4_9RHOB|nr:DUF302 domain-containing protein [Donghicola tyrosinivorans]PRY91853.1 hypothetical protein CLV74_103443 [Donghicola tyrosinivorans]